jgi:hypothetical protein
VVSKSGRSGGRRRRGPRRRGGWRRGAEGGCRAGFGCWCALRGADATDWDRTRGRSRSGVGRAEVAEEDTPVHRVGFVPAPVTRSVAGHMVCGRVWRGAPDGSSPCSSLAARRPRAQRPRRVPSPLFSRPPDHKNPFSAASFTARFARAWTAPSTAGGSGPRLGARDPYGLGRLSFENRASAAHA